MDFATDEAVFVFYTISLKYYQCRNGVDRPCYYSPDRFKSGDDARKLCNIYNFMRHQRSLIDGQKSEEESISFKWNHTFDENREYWWLHGYRSAKVVRWVVSPWVVPVSVLWWWYPRPFISCTAGRSPAGERPIGPAFSRLDCLGMGLPPRESRNVG